MKKRLDILITILKAKLGILLRISLGVFLFVLFFQPFPIERFDFNNKLLFVAGLGTIVFLLMILRLIFATRYQIDQPDNSDPVLPSYPADFFLLIITTVAFAFYLRFVGDIAITFYIMFKVGLISLASLLILRVSESFRELSDRNEALIKHQIDLQKRLEKHEEDLQNKSIEIISENRNENLKLQVADIVFMRSADNYVEVFHREGDDFKKELIRSTLKNIEQQTKSYSNFVRCHRTSIVNTYYVEKLNKSFNNHWLSLKGIDEKIPVSRQYLLIVKENL